MHLFGAKVLDMRASGQWLKTTACGRAVCSVNGLMAARITDVLAPSNVDNLPQTLHVECLERLHVSTGKNPGFGCVQENLNEADFY